MRRGSLAEWLRWQESLHPAEIELGLDRVGQVAGKMPWSSGEPFLFTVGGTNGKGSAVAMLETILGAAGYRTGAYTSPHLLRYNERVRVQGREVTDEVLCRAFERVDRARGEVSLTYFEFGTLAAMDIFREAGCEVAILEVGLGGRLDAVNLFDADVCLIMSVAVDHTDWLGVDREAIGREKAGIFRAGRPAVCGDPDPPLSLQQAARVLEAPLYLVGRDWDLAVGTRDWSWRGAARSLDHLPHPSLPGDVQVRNAATVLTALDLVADRLPVGVEAIHRGLSNARLPGRLQVLEGPVERILDVAHNPEAAARLAEYLGRRPCRGSTHGLVAMLADKDMQGVAGQLAGQVDQWHVAALQVPRGADAGTLARVIRRVDPDALMRSYPGVSAAYRDAMASSGPGDRLVVFGSFFTVAAVLRLESSGMSPETVGDG